MTATRNLTPMVTWISAAATKASLNPHTTVGVYRGSYEIQLDAKAGPDSVFGAVTVGIQTGRVLRGFLRNGNEGTTTEYKTGAELLRALHALTPEHVAPYGATARGYFTYAA